MEPVSGGSVPEQPPPPCAVLPGSRVLAVILVALLLDPLKDTRQRSEGETPSVWSALLSTFRLLRDRRLRLLVLLPTYSGFEQAFLAGDYTRVGRAGDCWGGTRWAAQEGRQLDVY